MYATTLQQSATVQIRALDDEALVTLVRNGSQLALGELYRRHAADLTAFLRARARGRDADDVVQETFIVVLNKPQFLPGPGRTRAWLRGIALRIASSHHAVFRAADLTDADAMIGDRAVGDEIDAPTKWRDP